MLADFAVVPVVSATLVDTACDVVDGSGDELISTRTSFVKKFHSLKRFVTCKDSGYIATKTAKIKKVILLSSTSPYTQSADKQCHLLDFCCFSCVI